MFSNNFALFRAQAKKFDEDIVKLTETWKLPGGLVGGYAECSDETVSFSKVIRTSLKNIQDSIDRQIGSNKALSDDEDFEDILQKSEADYNQLKSECDDLNTVLEEYGYHYEDSNTPIYKTKVLEVEFTPQLSWKCKTTMETQLTPMGLPYLHKPESYITPINKSLASVLAMDTPAKNELKKTYTPGRDRPQEPIYSTHFYSAQKK